MRLQAVPLPSLVAFFWPLALSAVPGATAQGAASLIAKDASSENLGLIKRANVDCYIVNSNSPSVNCRSGPGFGYSVVAAASVGMVYNFDCYETGDCYEDNCTWDRVLGPYGDYCFINGYYTDSSCTVAALGTC